MLRLLECALALDRLGNYARAAQQVCVSQPTLTRNIQELERQLGVRLFDRTRRGVTPTVFGTALLERAKGIEAIIKDLRREIDLLKGLDTGELFIGIGPLVAQTWMPEAVAALLSNHPDLCVRIVTHDWWDLVKALRDRRIDIAIGEIDAQASEPDIAVSSLPHRPIHFYCRSGHPLTRVKAPTIREIGEYPMVASKLPPRTGEFLGGTRAIGKLVDSGRYFEPQIECQTFESCLRIVKASDAISLAPTSKLKPLAKQEGIALVNYVAPWLRTNYGIITLRDRTLAPSAVAFCDQVIATEKLHHEVQAIESKKLRKRR